MPKKSHNPKPETKVQVSFRTSPAMKSRIVQCADSLGIGDESTLVRMLVTEFLHVYEERAKEIHK